MNEYDILKRIFELENTVRDLKKEVKDGLHVWDKDTGYSIRIEPCEVADMIWGHIKDEDIHVPRVEGKEKK